MPARPYLTAPVAALALVNQQVRRLSDADLMLLPALLVEAYRGTIDDDGETEDDARKEIERLFAGRSGPPIQEACLVVDDSAGGLASAVLTTRWWGTPFLCFVVTAPEERGKGLATALIRTAAAILDAAGETDLGLVVTSGNPAQALYSRLGFVERPRPT